MKERLELIMQEEGNISAYEFSKALGFKRPDALYKVLDGSTKNPGVEFVRAVKKKFRRYTYEWLLDGIGEKYEDVIGGDLRMSKDKDNRITQLEKMLADETAKSFRYENVIDSLMGAGKKYKGVSNQAKLDLSFRTDLVNLHDDLALMANGSFDRNIQGFA